jgi:Cellulase (glycosyl hydrolase family 5)
MRRLSPLLLLLTTLVFVPAARAAGPQLGIADDRVLLGGGPAADQAVQDWKAMGIQQVRIYALWSRIAPNARSKSKPKGFDGANASSAKYNWAALDGAVDRVAAAGLQPILTITGPGPLWSSRYPSKRKPAYFPSPSKYASFAKAVAKRYGDRVNRYILWNEPNLAAWLQPQASCKHHHCYPVAAHVYRSLVRAAYPAVHQADKNASVWIGATSSRGSDLHSANSTERPLVFLRALGCVDSKFAKVRTGRCKGFHSALADGYAYHPHAVLVAPDKPFANKDDADLASLGRVESTLDKLQAHGRLRATTHRFSLYLDEFGYQTNPPDKLVGVSLATQDKWLQQAAYMAWRDKRVKLFSQYLWYDDPVSKGGSYSGWQSGLRFADGRAKPALAHFPTPFALDAAHGRLWGQVRRRDSPSVTIERKAKGGSTWKTVHTARTDSQGYWSWSTKLSTGASYRYLAAGVTSSTLKRR